jgi:hypothetical protein
MPTMSELQELVVKYRLTKSGTKTEVAQRIYDLRSIYLSTKVRKLLEDFLHMPERKKEKRKRIPLPKN